MGESKLSRDWEKVFSQELSDMPVSIHEDEPNIEKTTTTVQLGDHPRVDIFLSKHIKKEISKVAVLRHEHGLLELDSFGIKSHELDNLNPAARALVENIRVNLHESDGHRGYSDGFRALKGELSGGKVEELVYNSTQNKSTNRREERIFKLAREVNEASGAYRGEIRSDTFYKKYDKFAREVIKYIGDLPPQPEDEGDEDDGDGQPGDGSQEGPNGKAKPGKGNGNGKGSGQGGEGEGDGEGSSGDKPTTSQEQSAANSAAQQAANQLGKVFAQHQDVATGRTRKGSGNHGGGGSGIGVGQAMEYTGERPRADSNIQELVNEKFRKLKMAGKRSYEAGMRLNMRIAMRARFTGETKMFKVPAKDDIKNAKFVILQDISGSMGCNDMRVFGKQKCRYEIAYHFGKAMEEFLEKNGAKVESYRFSDGPFEPGLALLADGGTSWTNDNTNQLVEWVQAGYQVIILTDGGIAFHNPKKVKELFATSNRRPVGLDIGSDYGSGYKSPLDEVNPDWHKFKVTSNPSEAMDAIVVALAQRFRW